MQHTLTFAKRHSYDTVLTGITIPVELCIGQNRVTIPLAKLDTGASFCIFQKEFGEALEIDIESGSSVRIETATGSFSAYGHQVILSALGFEFDVMVYFATLPGFNRNVLGRLGWLHQIRLGLIDYDGTLFVSQYNDSNETD